MKQASRLAQGFIVGTISVKRSQLVLFPASAVMRVPIILTVDLDASGAAHLYTLVRFVKGGNRPPAVMEDVPPPGHRRSASWQRHLRRRSM